MGEQWSGDGGPASSAQLWGPLGLFIDTSNNVYIGDCGGNGDVSVVREVFGSVGAVVPAQPSQAPVPSQPSQAPLPDPSGQPSTQPSNQPTRQVCLSIRDYLMK